MGTNFYWMTEPKLPDYVVASTGERVPVYIDDCIEIHIGKRSAAGGGKMSFSWCTDPDVVARTITEWENDPQKQLRKIAIDEYGAMYTASQLRARLAECEIKIEKHIGTSFC